MSAFLRKSEIENARQKAEDYLKLNQIQRTAEDCLPEARRRISEPPYPSLPDALVSLVAEKGFPITQDKAVKFIKEADERKPAISVLQRPIQSPGSERRAENTQRKPQKNFGKMAFVDALLMAKGGSRKTKTEIVELFLKEFPDVKEKTAKNTVSWASSTMKKRTGKESNHLPTTR